MLVGYNQLTSPTPYTLYYYLPELVMAAPSSFGKSEQKFALICSKNGQARH